MKYKLILVFAVAFLLAAGLTGCAGANTGNGSLPSGGGASTADETGAALSLLQKEVPELSGYAKQISNNSNGKASLTVFINGHEKGYYSVYVGESWPDHNVNWFTFEVNDSLSQVLIKDSITGDLLTLNEWRKSSQYIE